MFRHIYKGDGTTDNMMEKGISLTAALAKVSSSAAESSSKGSWSSMIVSSGGGEIEERMRLAEAAPRLPSPAVSVMRVESAPR